MSDSPTTARSRELGHELRTVRERIGYTGAEMANRLGWSQSRLSRVEHGKSGVDDVDVALYLGGCGVFGVAAERIVALAREPDEGCRAIPDGRARLAASERAASRITNYEPMFVPSALRTPGYAHALLAAADSATTFEIDDQIRSIMDRQRALTRGDPPHCTFFVHEHVLGNSLGSVGVMREQLMRLLDASHQPRCELRVVPIAAGGRGLVGTPFQSMRFPGDDPVVFVETEGAGVFLESPRAARIYQRLIDRLDTVALPERHSREAIADWAGQYTQLGAAS